MANSLKLFLKPVITSNQICVFVIHIIIIKFNEVLKNFLGY